MEALASQCGASLQVESRFFGLTGRVTLSGHDLRLLIPTTFMNRSGMAVAAMAGFFKIAPEHILVAHDELDIPPGCARFKQGGGHGGHNGLRDIIPALGNNQDFHRLRIGIGHPGDASQVINYVLHKPSMSDLNAIENANRDTLAVMPLIVEGRIDKAMQALHT